MVLMVHIEKDTGPDRELIKIKIMTPYPPHETFRYIRQTCLGKIEELHEMTLQETTLTKLN
jgi:hypothetical protein